MAAPGSDYCVVHRDQLLYVRVSGRKGASPTLCEKCAKPIKPGTIAKRTLTGLVHAEYVCES